MGNTMGNDTLDCLCRDAHSHLATASPASVGFDFAGLFQTLWPYILEAIKALIAAGNPAPTSGQVLVKAHELAAAHEITAGQDA
jgi:hypothetical protein